MKILGNEMAIKQLEEYVQAGCTMPALLYGPSGIGKRFLINEMAGTMLECNVDELELHPDYHIFSGKMKMEDMEAFLKNTEVKSSSGIKVFIFDHVKLSTHGMNKLLKLLEDKVETNKVFFLSEKYYLPTIESRCVKITFHALSASEMLQFFQQINVVDNQEWFAFVCENCPGKYQNDVKVYQSLLELYQKFISCKTENLFQLFHLVQEKDSLNTYEKFKDHKKAFLSIFQFLFFKILQLHLNNLMDFENEIYKVWASEFSITQTFQILQRAEQDRRDEMYNKNKFFDLIRFIAKGGK